MNSERKIDDASGFDVCKSGRKAGQCKTMEGNRNNSCEPSHFDLKELEL